MNVILKHTVVIKSCIRKHKSNAFYNSRYRLLVYLCVTFSWQFLGTNKPIWVSVPIVVLICQIKSSSPDHIDYVKVVWCISSCVLYHLISCLNCVIVPHHSLDPPTLRLYSLLGRLPGLFIEFISLPPWGKHCR